MRPGRVKAHEGDKKRVLAARWAEDMAKVRPIAFIAGYHIAIL